MVVTQKHWPGVPVAGKFGAGSKLSVITGAMASAPAAATPQRIVTSNTRPLGAYTSAAVTRPSEATIASAGSPPGGDGTMQARSAPLDQVTPGSRRKQAAKSAAARAGSAGSANAEAGSGRTNENNLFNRSLVQA